MMLLLLVPLGTVALLLLADIALQVVTKLRLQVAADHAALRAAESLAGSMDAMGAANVEVRQTFDDLEADLQSNTVKDQQEGEKRVAEARATIDALRAQMEARLDDGYQSACEAARQVVAQQAPWAEMLPLSGGTFTTDANGVELCEALERLFVMDDVDADLTFAYNVNASTIYEPISVKQQTATLLHYRRKAETRGQQVAFGLHLRASRPPSFFVEPADDVADDPYLVGTAAAQPFGGSIEDGEPYEATLVPIKNLQDSDAGYRGLRFYDPAAGWIEEEGTYAY
jgi:ElaB/YqjD/DUF883 family membrane-anchored ribosome-binding protein